jgi:AcrR family transcriptional regulator
MSKPSKRGRPTIPPEQQRRRLLDAAERSFEQNRYEGVSIQQIVREAGMSSRSFYQFFDSKEDLVTELARDRGEALLVEMKRVIRGADDLLSAVDQMLRVYLEGMPMVILDLERLSGTASQQVRLLRETYRERIGSLLTQEVERLVEAGQVSSAPNPMSVALVLAGIEGISIHYHFAGRREELLALHPRLLESLREIFPEHLSGDAKSA